MDFKDGFFKAYLIGLKVILKRILWDFNLRSFVSRRKLKYIKGSYKGQKAVILCNGPSLLKVDFDELMRSDAKIFGLNKIHLMFDRTNMRPDFIVAVNKHVIEQSAEIYKKINIPIFIDYKSAGYVGNAEHVTYIGGDYFPAFSTDCSYSVYQGYTVTFVAMQLAYHMGFESVALVGCDHSFSAKGPSNATVVSEASDADHFDPRYFSGGVKWQLPDLIQSEISYLLAKDAYSKAGRKIFNCTEGGCLEIFERMSLSDFLKED